jgi:hypothetical protein
MILALRLHWVVIRRVHRLYQNSRTLARELAPYVCVIVVSLFNLLLGGFATFDGPALISAVMYFGLLAAETQKMRAAPAHAFRTLHSVGRPPEVTRRGIQS